MSNEPTTTPDPKETPQERREREERERQERERKS
jgi:hypothetical protein